MKVQKNAAVRVTMTEEAYNDLYDSLHHPIQVETIKTVRIDMLEDEFSIAIYTIESAINIIQTYTDDDSGTIEDLENLLNGLPKYS